MFCHPHVRAVQSDWDSVARFAVAAFRADVARAGAAKNVEALVDELCRLSPEFEAIWAENDVRSTYGEVAKTLRHPLAGVITLEISSFVVNRRPDLELVIYNPATREDAERIGALIESQPKAPPRERHAAPQ
jgi:hypothetical protein